MNSSAPFSQGNLDRCISCGFCLSACPTYLLTGDEASSPRGRINLMRGLQEGELSFSEPSVSAQASMCLGCRACEPVCPAGVKYGELLEEWRDQTWVGSARPWIVPTRLPRLPDRGGRWSLRPFPPAGTLDWRPHQTQRMFCRRLGLASRTSLRSS